MGQLSGFRAVSRSGSTAAAVGTAIAAWCGVVLAVACGRILGEWAENRFLRWQWERECRAMHDLNVRLAQEQRQHRLLRQQQESARLEAWRRLLKEIA
jgi:hypothetical protein